MNSIFTLKANSFSVGINFYSKKIIRNSYFFLVVNFGLLFLITSHTIGQTVTITTTGNGTFTVPCDVTSITVQAWGGGGAGGGSRSNNSKGGGGGAGGTYVTSVLAVTPGQTINYFVGSGGNGTANPGEDGTASWFNTTGTLYAQGGEGGEEPNNTTVAGGTGSTAASIGTTRIAGNNGANGTTTVGGAGGNSPSGGNGGNQITSGGNGNNGNSPGGGGGGAFVSNNTNRAGGNGGNGQIRLVYSSTLSTYCVPTFTTDVEPITNVTFAGINNTTSPNVNGTPDIEYFCQTASVVQGSATNAISVKGNTAGPYTTYIRAYIDWDRSGTYGNNANEIYDLGTIYNSTGIDGVILNSSIAVPAAALIGNTNMRIMKRYGAYSTNACQTGGGYGQAEEYIVNVSVPVPPTITSFPSSDCVGSSIVISGTDLSSATSVTIGGTIATITATSSTSVTVTVGSGTTGIISVTTAGGTANSATNFTVYATPGNPGSLSSTASPYCSPVIISSNGTPASGFTWYWQTTPDGTSTANSNPTYSLTTPGSQTIYLRSQNNTTGCWSLPGVRSITRIVIEPITTLATNPIPTANATGVCYAGSNATTTLTWNGASGATSYDVYFGTISTPPLVATRTVTNYTTGTLLPSTTYYWRIIPSNICGSTSATPIIWSFTTSNAPCYCDATVSNGRQDDNYINAVRFIGTLNDLSNLNTGYSNSPIGYQDFTGLANRAIQAQGEGVNVFLESPSLAMIRAWVDWNNDGVFNTTGAEAVYTSGLVSAYSTTFGFVIPTNQTPGVYRIRLRTNNSGGSSTISPCGNINNGGETEDYLFQVIPSCGAVITGVSNGENCADSSGGNVNVPLSATGSSGTTEIRWYNALTGGTLVQTTAVSSGTTANWSPAISTTTKYYVTSFNGSCESLVRTEILATIKPVSNITYLPANPESCGENTIVTLTATGDYETVTLIDEDFEASNLSGVGVFSVQTLGLNNAQANWARKQSTFIPSQQVWFPAISSGFGPNKFAMATSDVGPGSYDNALRSPVVNTTNFVNLNLSFKMYYSDYYTTVVDDNVSIEVSTNGGTTWTSTITYNSNIGIGTRFSEITLNVPNAYLNQTNLRFRFRYTSGWADGVAIDDVKLVGQRPLAPSFDWGATPVDAYQNFACTIPYVSGTTIGTVYVKPTLAQLELGTFNFVATATLANGCTSSQPITITNKSRVWKGTFSQNWNDPNNWLPLGVPTLDNCVIIPANTKIPINSASPPTGYDAYAKTLTIKSTGYLEILSGNNLTVKEWIQNDGSNNFFIRNNSSLIQIDNVANSGTVIMDRTASVKKTDYVYYSSPVDGFSMSNLSTSTPSAVKFKWLPTTVVGGGFVFGNWANAGSDIMSIGRGYIVRGPSSFLTPQPLTATFNGPPRNGDITVPISRGNYVGANTTYQGRLVTKDDDNYNLIGNPYPSAISVNTFLSEPQNSNILGSIYLWPHGGVLSPANSDPFYQDFVYNYDSADYITYNSMGPVPIGTFNGYVAAGQSFFVLMTDTASTSENVYFNNGMRVSNNNSQFLRTANETVNTTNETEELELHRIWLDMILPTGKTSSILVGYTPNATYGVDRLFDTPLIDTSSQNLYSKINDEAMIIQGRPSPVDVADRITLGILIPEQGIYSIAINSLDGVFNDAVQHIFLEDMETGIIHNLKNAPYMFNASAGRYDNRFILRYNDESILGTTEYFNNSDLNIIKLNGIIKITSENSPIDSVTIHDVLGRSVMEFKKVNSDELKIPFDNMVQGTYIVKVILQNGLQKTKKVIH